VRLTPVEGDSQSFLWYPVYTIQPVVKPAWQPVWQQVVSCKRGLTVRAGVMMIAMMINTGVRCGRGIVTWRVTSDCDVTSEQITNTWLNNGVTRPRGRVRHVEASDLSRRSSYTHWPLTGHYRAAPPSDVSTRAAVCINKNSSRDEIANVNFYAVRPEATRIRWNNAK